MSSEARKIGGDVAPKISRSATNEVVRQETETVASLKSSLKSQQLFYAESFEQLAYALTHDMRELLRMVRSYLALQSRPTPAQDGEENEFATYILDGTQRMEQLLSELTVYSHQFRPLEQPAEATDSEAVLAGVLLTLDAVVRKSKTSVTYDALPKVWCEATKLGHLFRHLIHNAIIFRRQEPPQVQVSATQDGNQAVFCVRDNGLGIDPRYHDQIFAIFKRLHGRDYPGNGLGLAICKLIVEQYGGRIWVESEPGQGSTFLFTLPASS
jgi:light-regulated signal transduction histidine kinase (bacteriophytochrome)